MKTKRNCRMCGIQLPPLGCYKTDWCWMCWRAAWEKEHHRYYVLRKPQTQKGESSHTTYYEEVQSLRGVFAFSEENKPLIRKEIDKEKAKLSKKVKENSNREKLMTYTLKKINQ